MIIFFQKHNLTKYIKGKGVEIGALNNPLKIGHTKAEVLYVDMAGKEELIEHNPEVCGEKIKQPDIISDAENLSIITDESINFVIVNHLLEHLPNPIKGLEEFHRVLKPEGILYLAIPDKRYTFDRERPITALSHLIQDYKEGTTIQTSVAHYQEWLTLVELKKKNPITRNLEDLMNKQYRIHFHVWAVENILELLNYMKNDRRVYFKLIDYYYRNGDTEAIFILKKVNSSIFPDFSSPLKERYSIPRFIFYRLKNFLRG